MVYLCMYWFCFFLCSYCMVLYLVYLFDFDFSGDYVNGRELVMVYLCLYWSCFFVYGIVLDVCLFDFDFSSDYVIELFGK